MLKETNYDNSVSYLGKLIIVRRPMSLILCLTIIFVGTYLKNNTWKKLQMMITKSDKNLPYDAIIIDK